MDCYNIALVRGDGIGPEIVEQAVLTLDAVAAHFGFTLRYTDVLAGGCAIDATGFPLPQASIDACLASDAVLLGAVGGPQWDELPAHSRPEKALLGLRKALGLYANLRPARLFAPLASACPLRPDIACAGLDFIIVRELIGGIYFGASGRETRAQGEYAFDTMAYSAPEIRRVGRIAFELARSRSGRLCSIDKANVLESSRLWRQELHALATCYPDVQYRDLLVDNAAMQLVIDPSQFDVIVTENLFGDILSDEASAICGSIGLLPSASMGDGTRGLFEPIHGSAPTLAGKDIANPIGTILSAALLLRQSLCQVEAASAIEAAVAAALDAGLRTMDIAFPGQPYQTCSAMGCAIRSLLPH